MTPAPTRPRGRWEIKDRICLYYRGRNGKYGFSNKAYVIQVEEKEDPAGTREYKVTGAWGPADKRWPNQTQVKYRGTYRGRAESTVSELRWSKVDKGYKQGADNGWRI